MSRKQSTTAAAPVAAPAPAPVAQIVHTVAATPQRRGESTVAKPVAVVWVTCYNLCSTVTPQPSRKSLMAACINAGVTYYTARTQVDAYLRAPKGDNGVPLKLPQGVVIG